ncbi:MAG: hypothetical protein ACU83U_09035 [Gammaproteobacteria bacterium]
MLSKVFALKTAAELKTADGPQLDHDSSTDEVIRRYRRFKKGIEIVGQNLAICSYIR